MDFIASTITPNSNTAQTIKNYRAGLSPAGTPATAAYNITMLGGAATATSAMNAYGYHDVNAAAEIAGTA
jgi:hypothetical protein